MTTYKLLRTHKLMKAHKFQCWIILVQFLITNGLNIFRGDLGDIKYDDDDGQPCPNGTFLIHQDETHSITCIITMDEGGCNLKFNNKKGSKVGFIPENNGNTIFDVISTCTNKNNLALANLRIQDYPFNVNKQVWTTFGVDVIEKFINVQSSPTENKISVMFTGFTPGVLLRIQFYCVDGNRNGTVDSEDSDGLCVYVKFGGNLEFPLTARFIKSTSATFVTSMWMEMTTALIIPNTTSLIDANVIELSKKEVESIFTTNQFSKETITEASSVEQKAQLVEGGGRETNLYILIGALVGSFVLITLLIVILIVQSRKRRIKKEKENLEKTGRVSKKIIFGDGRKSIILKTPEVFQKYKYEEFDAYDIPNYRVPQINETNKSLGYTNTVYNDTEPEEEAPHLSELTIYIKPLNFQQEMTGNGTGSNQHVSII